MLRPLLISLLACSSLFALACGDAESDETTPRAQASFTTFNAGLARGFVDYATARTQPVADAVAALDSDVVCLQEVWLFEDDQDEWSTAQIDAIVETASQAFPHHYLDITEDTGGDTPNCNADDTGPIESCVAENCADVSDDNLAGCALGNCQTEFNDLSGSCQQCIGANIGGSIDDILAACTGEVGGSAYSYNGHNGLLLLSKHPLTDTDSLVLNSEIVQRAVLRATVDLPDYGPTDVYCTHLQANLAGAIAYPEDATYSSYEEEQAAQINAITAYIDQSAQSEDVVLMGDMNNGPAVGDLAAAFPQNYDKFSAAGMTNPYLDTDDPRCTYCGDNPLVGGSANVAIDHIFTRSSRAIDVVGAARVLDQSQTISTDEGDQELPLSDHYGVSVTLQAP